MFNRRDFPDYKTEAAVARDRHGPPALTNEEQAALEAARQSMAREIIAAYDGGSKLVAIVAEFAEIGSYRIRQIIAKKNFERAFPDQNVLGSFREDLERSLCSGCLAAYFAFEGPWERWLRGQRLTLPRPPVCLHGPSGGRNSALRRGSATKLLPMDR
jgi:hypothetical protein